MLGFRARWLSVFVTLLGCSGSNVDGESPPHGGSGGGANASAGRPGEPAAAGAAANGGMVSSGGRFGSGGTPSGGSAAGGMGSMGSGGHAAGNGGAGSAGANSNLTGGTGGNLGGAGSGGVGERGPAPTFSTIYTTIITPNCGGAQCHLKRPTPFGYDFSSKSAASAAWRADVFPGNADGSPMFQVLDFGIMPKDRPPLSIAQLYMVYDWINAGALDN